MIIGDFRMFKGDFRMLLSVHRKTTGRVRFKQRRFHINCIPKVWLHKRLTKNVMPAKLSSPKSLLESWRDDVRMWPEHQAFQPLTPASVSPFDTYFFLFYPYFRKNPQTRLLLNNHLLRRNWYRQYASHWFGRSQQGFWTLLVSTDFYYKVDIQCGHL